MMRMETFSAHSQETRDYLKEKYRNDILKANEEFVQFKIGISKKVPSALHSPSFGQSVSAGSGSGSYTGSGSGSGSGS